MQSFSLTVTYFSNIPSTSAHLFVNMNWLECLSRLTQFPLWPTVVELIGMVACTPDSNQSPVQPAGSSHQSTAG